MHETIINRELAMYITNSGNHEDAELARFAIEAAANTVPQMLSVLGGSERVRDIWEFDHPDSRELGEILARNRSDKSTEHDYHRLYAFLLGPVRDAELNVFEVGLGSPNPGVFGSMGEGARAGASLYAWREYLPIAHVFGADVDAEILFADDRIKTFHVDQTRPQTFAAIDDDVPPLDLLIDDGLHCTHANLATLAFGVRKVQVGGSIVIEDIREASLPVWHVARRLLPAGWTSFLVRARYGFLFVAQRGVR